MGTSKTIELGSGVIYTDQQGQRKAAIVTALPETVLPDGMLKLADDQVMLMVFSPNHGGSIYSRLAIQAEDGTFQRTEPVDFGPDSDW